MIPFLWSQMKCNSQTCFFFIRLPCHKLQTSCIHLITSSNFKFAWYHFTSISYEKHGYIGIRWSILLLQWSNILNNVEVRINATTRANLYNHLMKIYYMSLELSWRVLYILWMICIISNWVSHCLKIELHPSYVLPSLGNTLFLWITSDSSSKQ